MSHQRSAEISAGRLFYTKKVSCKSDTHIKFCPWALKNAQGHCVYLASDVNRNLQRDGPSFSLSLVTPLALCDVYVCGRTMCAPTRDVDVRTPRAASPAMPIYTSFSWTAKGGPYKNTMAQNFCICTTLTGSFFFIFTNRCRCTSLPQTSRTYNWARKIHSLSVVTAMRVRELRPAWVLQGSGNKLWMLSAW